MTYDEIIEVLAEARWNSGVRPYPWVKVTSLTKDAMRQDARAALSALRTLAEERGYRLMVPVEVTEDMDEAGMKGAVIHDEWGENKYLTNAPAVFRAMLSAAPDPTKEP